MNKALIAILSAAVIGAAKNISTNSSNSGSSNSDSEHEREKQRRIEEAYKTFNLKPVVDYTLQQLESLGVQTQAQGRPVQFDPQQPVPQTAIAAFQQKDKRWKANVLPILVREQVVFNATKGILKINDDAWETFSDAEKLGKVIHATSFYKIMGAGKKSPFANNPNYTVYDVIEYFADPSRSKLHKGMYGRSRASKQTQDALAQVQSKYSRINQNTRHEKIQYPNSIMSTIECLEFDCFDENGNKIQEGILERTYASDQANIFPVGFINFIRCIYGAHYYSVNYDLLRTSGESNSSWKTALDDTYVFNPLTSEFGKVTTEWMFGVVQKMKFLEDKYSELSTGLNLSNAGQSWFSKLYTLVSEVFSDKIIYKRVITKWKSLGKGRDGLTRDGKMPLDLAKDIHMLVAGFIYRIIREYNKANLVEYILLSDISAQNLSPFGACNFSSYKSTINNLIEGICEPSYKLTESKVDTLFTVRGYETGGSHDVLQLDGLGYIVDLLVNRGWARLLDNCKADPQIAQAVFLNGEFASLFGFNADQADGGPLTVSFRNSTLQYTDVHNWKINGEFFVNDFTVYFLGKKNAEFRQFANSTDHNSDILKWLYSSENTFELKMVALENIEDKFIAFGHWLFETMSQLTRVIGSGQIELAQYLISPILDISYLDKQAKRYGLRPSRYPSHIIKQMEEQKVDAQKQIKSQPAMYRQAVDSFDNGLRKFFSDFINQAKIFKNNDPSAVKYFLNLSFRECMVQSGMAPYADIDYGNPMEPLDPKQFVRFKVPLMAQGLAAQEGFEHLKSCWIYNHDPSIKKLTAKHFSVEELFAKNGLPRPQNANEEWAGLEAEFNRLKSEGLKLEVMTNQEQSAHAKYASLYQKDMMKSIVRLFNHLAKTYSVSTEIISSSPAIKIIGLVFGGQDFSSIAPNVFMNYLNNSMEPNTEIPTQSISYQGVRMVPTATALRQKDNTALLEKIRGLGTDTHAIVDLIAETLDVAGVFGVPFTNKMGYMYGISFASMPSEASEKLYFYKRNGLLSSRGLNVNPQRYVNFSNTKLLSVPEGTWEEIKKSMEPSMILIHRSQDIILPMIQELMEKFTDKNNDDFGTSAVYMKVRTIGFHQLAVLSDDPLGFREMYRNLNSHDKVFSQLSVDNKKKLPLLNPNMLKYKDIKSRLDARVVDACTIVESDVILKTLCDEKATINLKGKITYNTNNPLEQELIRLCLPFIHHMMNKKSSLDKPSKQEVKEWESIFDKLCGEMFHHIKKINLLRDLYTYLKRAYKNPVLPVADFENMDEEQLIILLSRYKEHGPYQVIEGVNYPTTFLELVQKQLDAKKSLSKDAPSQYVEFQSEYKKAYDSSYVQRQSEKIGALVGILNGGYRIYMPYTGEHLRNVARATNTYQSLDRSPSRSITEQDKKAIKERKSYAEIRSLIDAISYDFSSDRAASMCIGGGNYTGAMDSTESRENSLHLIVVSPDGLLFFVTTISINNKKLPTSVKDFESVYPSGSGQYPPLAWRNRLETLSTEQMKEKLEITSWVGRNFVMWLKEWMESPYMVDGNKNNWPAVNWNAIATSAATDWKKSPLYASLVGNVNKDNSFEDLVNRGALSWKGNPAEPSNKGNSLSFYEDNAGFWGGILGDIDLLTSLYPNTAGVYIGPERRARIERLRQEGKLG